MLDKLKYKKDWETKKKCYAKNFPNALLITEESSTLSRDAQRLIQERFVL